MTQRSKSEIAASVQRAIQAASPQVRVDVNKGPFYYLAVQGVSGPMATVSADVERMALLSTLQFPTVATTSEALALARAFGLTLGQGGYARGIAYATTGRRPFGSEVFTVEQGAVFATAVTRGQVFEATETRSLTDANADVYYNPTTRRYELPVQVRAVAAGESGNIPARTLVTVQGGAANFEGVTNIVSFTGGAEAQSVAVLYARARQRLLGINNFSRGGMQAVVQNLDVDRIQATALTYTSDYPSLFYRLPDTQAVDVWMLNVPQDSLVTETFTATAGQSQFYLNNKPVLYLTAAFVNGTPVTATLVLDTSLAVGRSTREASYVSLAVPALVGDVVDITYGFDEVPNTVQSGLDGYLNAATGALFATDILVRYSKSLPVAVTVTGTVLGTFDPTTVEAEVATVVGEYIANGTGDAPLLGGSRTAAELRDMIRSQVPGISTLTISIFGRKSLGQIVEAIDIPRNSNIIFEVASDLVVNFT